MYLYLNEIKKTLFLTLYDLGKRISSVWLKFWFQKKEGIIEKISYGRRVYESVDDRSLS